MTHISNMKTKVTKMATIEKRGNSFLISVSAGYNSQGKQVRRTMTWKPDQDLTPKQVKKELERQTVLFEDKVKTGRIIDSSISFADFTDKWLSEYAEKQLAPKTIARYRSLLERVKPAIGHIRLDRLQPHHLLEFYNSLAEKGIREDKSYLATVNLPDIMTACSVNREQLSRLSGISTTTISAACQGHRISSESAQAICRALKIRLMDTFEEHDDSSGLSAKTILHHHRLISSILSTAVKWQVIFSNPAERVQPPKVVRKEPPVLG
jgi:integrase